MIHVMEDRITQACIYCFSALEEDPNDVPKSSLICQLPQ